MRILLIGHEGYIGSGLYRYLSTRYQVTCWGKKNDICTLNAPILKELKIKAIINCAAVIDRISMGFVVGSESDRVNVNGMYTLVRALKDQEVKLIHISTKDVFGMAYTSTDVDENADSYKPKFFIDDNHAFSPETTYAKTKLMSEYIAESHPFAVIIRLSCCYTDYYHHRGSWIHNLIKILLQGKPVTVTDEGKQFRAPLNVDDLGGLIDNILVSNAYGVKINADGGINNIYSVLQVIRMIAPNAKINKVGDVLDYGFAFNNRLAGTLFNWKPSILLSDRLPVMRENINLRRAISV